MMAKIGCLWTFTLFDERDRVIDYWTWKNFLTDAGCEHLILRSLGTSQAVMSHIAIGTGGGQDQTDTTLDNEIARIAMDATFPKQGSNLYEGLYQATFAAGTGTGIITEFAILNASSVGVMLNYASGFAPRDKQAGSPLLVTATLGIISGT